MHPVFIASADYFSLSPWVHLKQAQLRTQVADGWTMDMGSTPELQNYSTTVFHTYIPFDYLKRYKNTKKDQISARIGRMDGRTK